MLRQPAKKTREVALSFLRSIAPNGEPSSESFAKAAKKAGVTKKQLEFFYAAEIAGVSLDNPADEDEPDPDIDLPQKWELIEPANESPQFLPQIPTGDAAVSLVLELGQSLDQAEAELDLPEDDEGMPWEKRPFPAEELCEPASLNPDDDDYDAPIRVAPDHDLEIWVRETFIEPGGALFNEEHWHLGDARIGFLWTNVENHRSQDQRILGTAELVGRLGNKWQTARDHYQLLKWFGEVPDFIITLDAPMWAIMDDASACALIEHELYHCSIKFDKDGNPKETPDGDLIFGIRGHDIEQFVSVVERYGAKASHVEKMIEAARRGPTIAQAQISIACGTCRH